MEERILQVIKDKVRLKQHSVHLGNALPSARIIAGKDTDELAE
jgi:hypothetical protein